MPTSKEASIPCAREAHLGGLHDGCLICCNGLHYGSRVLLLRVALEAFRCMCFLIALLKPLLHEANLIQPASLSTLLL